MFKKIKQKLINLKNWVKRNIKKVAIALGIIGIAMAAGQIPEPPTLHEYQKVVWERPTTTQGWIEDVKKENLDIKYDYQLDQMEENLTEKLPRVQKDLDKFVNYPNYIKWELKEQFTQMFNDSEIDLKGKLESKTLQEWIDGEFVEQLAYYQWKTDKLNQSIERIKKEKELRYDELVIRSPEGTTYYIDCINGTNTSIGTATSTAGLDLDQFTEVARSAGDKVIVRRGGTACNNGSDLGFTSDGAIGNPIVIEADYDNAWGDDVDLSETGTATLTFGSKTITFSADISGVLATGDWIYVSGDAAKDFAYEVASVSTVTVTLYLPYKGNQAGSGKTMTNMGDAPIWATVAEFYSWNFDADHHWKIQGIEVRGTDSNGQVEIDDAWGHEFIDMIFRGNGSLDYGIIFSNGVYLTIIKKSRFYNSDYGAIYFRYSYGKLTMDSIFISGNNYVQRVTTMDSWQEVHINDLDAGNLTYGFIIARGNFYIRNTKVVTQYDEFDVWGNSNLGMSYYIEDNQGVIGSNLQTSGLRTSDSAFIVVSTSTTVRSGGGATSIEVRPTTNLSTNWDFSRIQLFEYPIYADTISKTYTVYFKTNATADWTDDPTNSELWIEAEYWGHATNNHRKVTKSTGVIDFNGSTAWQSLTVTVQPSQTGVLYLRGWYAKTKEAQSNVFYVDVKPTIE